MSLTASLWAQTAATAPVSAATAPATSAPASAAGELAGTPGVRPGMNNDALVELAAVHLQNGPKKEAQKILEAVNKADPRHARGLKLLAQIYEQQAIAAGESGDPQQARQGQALMDKAVDLYLTLGFQQYSGGDNVGAEQSYSHVLMRRSANGKAQLSLARLLATTNRPLLAIERYRDYLSNPSTKEEGDARAQANLELGQICRLQNFRAQAISALQAAEKLNPENPQVHVNLARTYLDTMNLDKARASAMTATRKAPSDPEGHDLLAQVMLAQKELNSARSESQQAISLQREIIRQQPEAQKPVKTMTELCKTRENVLQAILTKDSANTETRVELVRGMKERAEWARVLALHDALAALQEAPEQDKNKPALLELLVELESAVGNTEKAAATSRELLKLDPRNAVAARILGAAPRNDASPTTQAVAEKPMPSPKS